MKTASWYTFRGEGRIGISVGTPRGISGGYRLYRPLNPRREMLQLSHEDYDREFAIILGQLDPQKVWEDLHRLAGRAEPMLLCFEKPPFSCSNRCHRRTVAAWLEKKLGVHVPELDYDGPDR